MFNEIDLKILKIITSDNPKGLEFAYSYTPELFNENLHLFGNLFRKYTLAFKSIPTKNTMIEWCGAGYQEYLNEVWDKLNNYNDYNKVEYNYYLDKLKKKYIENILKQIQKYIVNDKNSADIKSKNIDLMMQKIRDVRSGKAFIHKTVEEHLEEFNNSQSAQDEHNIETKIMCHYSGIDYAKDGFRPAEFFLVGGETGSGKSVTLCNIARQMWMQKNTIDMGPNDFEHGYNILFFSLEMPYEDCFSRFIAALSKIDERKIDNNNLDSEEKNRLQLAQKFIKEYPYQFDIVDVPRGLTAEKMEMHYNDALLKYQPHVVIVDYLGCMDLLSNDQDWLKMGILAGQLHEFGRYHKVVTGSAVQLTDVQRGSKTNIKKKSDAPLVGPHRIGRSSHILHQVNLYLQLESRYNEHLYGDMKYHIVKNRRGPLLSASLIKDLEKCMLVDVPYEPSTVGPLYSGPEVDAEGYLKDSSDSDESSSDLKEDISARLENIRKNISNTSLRSRL